MAAYEIPGFSLGVLPANQDMSTEATYQYTGVDVIPATGSGLSGAAVAPVPSAGSTIIGVLQNNPQLGEAGAVMVGGVSKAQLGANVIVGELLMVNSTGQFIKATSGNFIVARALEAGVLNDVIPILLLPQGKL